MTRSELRPTSLFKDLRCRRSTSRVFDRKHIFWKVSKEFGGLAGPNVLLSPIVCGAVACAIAAWAVPILPAPRPQ
jgi:hypothetical protein